MTIQEKKDRLHPLNELQVVENKRPQFQPIYQLKPLRRNHNYNFYEQKLNILMIIFFIPL